MYKPKLEKDIRCPLEYGLDLFGKKWKSRIICVLAENGTMRYGTLRHEMANIHQDCTRALMNSQTVITAWDGDRLIGLVRALDDG